MKKKLELIRKIGFGFCRTRYGRNKLDVEDEEFMDISIMTWTEAHEEYRRINKELKETKSGTKKAKQLVMRKQKIIFRIQYLKANPFNKSMYC